MNTEQWTEVTESDYLKLIISAPVYDVAAVTPLEKMPQLSSRIHNTVLVKREDRQIVHSFKLRGAYTMLSQLLSKAREKGVIAASAGNHAQGVALSAMRLGIHAQIVMPVTTPDIKVQAVKDFGGDVLLYGANFDEAKNKAIELSQQQNRLFIPPFDHPLIIAGQGSIGLELLQQNHLIDRIFVPIGGGGLAAGIAVLIKQLRPEIKIIGVETQDSACFYYAKQAGKPVCLSSVGNFAEGVAVKQMGEETFKLCHHYLDDIVLVDSDAICSAIKDIFDDHRAIAEPSGALALAGLKQYVAKHKIQNEVLVHILSGANTNFHLLRYISERCELGEKRECLFAVTIPERKGSFLTFCQQLGKRVITEFNYRYCDKNLAQIFVGIRLNEGDDERQHILQMLQQQGYDVVDLSDNEMAKLHVRYMIGGKNQREVQERLLSFEFPESQGALLTFLETLGEQWNISLFHYRSHGTDCGRVLVGIEWDKHDPAFEQHLIVLGYPYQEETDNQSITLFLK